MIVRAGGSGVQWWLHAALAGVAVALTAGILGMHVLASSHAAHGAPTTLPESAAAAGHAGAITAHRAGPAGAPADAATMAPSEAPASGVSIGTGPGCDASCEVGAGALCLAVLGALLSLVLGRRARVLGSPGRADPVRIVLPSPASRAGPAPSLTVLCVSRT